MMSDKWVFADVYFLKFSSDKFINHWVGKNGGVSYIYDPLRQGWLPSPMSYQVINIKFRGEQIKGFTRQWGTMNVDRSYYDPVSKRTIHTSYATPWFNDIWYFFGFDGMVYRLVKKDAQGNPVKPFYYVNMTTGEQSIWEPRSQKEQERYNSLKGNMAPDGKPLFAAWQASPEKFPPSIVPNTETVQESESDGGQG